MLLSLLSLSWILSMIFMFLSHPLSFGFILLLQTIIISISSGMLNLDFWFSYILFLIMIGSMLVLFIYMTSIASNEKFKFSKYITMFLMIYIWMGIGCLNMDNYFSMSETSNQDFFDQFMYNINLSMNKFMNMPMTFLMILLMFYLLITLIAIVKISEFKMGTLRSSL
uniref:NADH-ubiquinone oxidoreductase chain 6 n=1 Tax=Otiorhynchus rugosostriatus TaxID=703598 RepID=J9PHW5_9CUCU|nr:NADH dehydrogenase subunit 6 [Otiorhynchus rugosostriatus]